jgi:two-component system NtrC family sensor kinase
MRKITVFCGTLLCCVVANGQPMPKLIDSLKHVVALSATYKQKIPALTRLADIYSEYNTDSCFFYAYLLRDVAIRAGDRNAEAYAIGDIASAYLSKGNQVQAMKHTLDALRRFEELGDSVNLANSYNGLGHMYTAQGNDSIAKMYYYKTYLLASRIGDHRDVLFGAMNLGQCYLKQGRLDSALYFSEIAFNTMKVYHVDYSNGSLLYIIAAINWKMGRKEIGDIYLRDALLVATQSAEANISLIQMRYASWLLKSGNTDSALHYANLARDELSRNSLMGRKMQLLSLYSKIYAGRKQFDSAYAYLQESLVIKDSFNTAAQVQQAANLSFNDQQRVAELQRTREKYEGRIRLYIVLAVLLLAVISMVLLFLKQRKQKKAHALLTKQKEQIQQTLAELKNTQAQLVQSEKMASLGELTAGIAHEIQNPLNFVNNFSEVSVELTEELEEEVRAGRTNDILALSADLKSNLQKILHHGKRADSIVKSMLQHSRSGSGQRERTDINALADEYLRLSYHGLRAKDKMFNATLETTYDPLVGMIEVLPQDLGRVFLNLINNAFYAVQQRRQLNEPGYQPTVALHTERRDGDVLICVRDNGTGIPQNVVEKIFQPFFTTKPTGEGTGLGLSLSYDIITKSHGGMLTVSSQEGAGTEFTIKIPVQGIPV